MDIKVKAMIKLIEEDADSFARRAEMYYKKRPELMKLVEEFYRAYRALAERYDHATGALCQAHQTMEEAFPNQLSFALSDESPSGSSSSDTETSPHSPALPRQMHVSHDSNNSQTGALGVPSQFHDITRTRESSEENDALMSKTGLKQLSEIVGSGEEAAQVLKEDQNLKSQITSKSVLADNAEVEVQSLKGTISYLESDKEAALLQHQLSLERISSMEAEISRYQEESKKLNDEMLMVVAKLNSAEERCALLDKENQALQLNLDTLNKREKDQHEELGKNREELERLNISLQDEHLQVVQAETARMSLEKSHSQSQKEVRLLTLEVQSGIEKLKDMELYNMGLEEEVREIKEENGSLNEKIISSAFKIISLQDEIIFLKNSKAKIEEELGLHAEEKKVLQQEFSCIKEDRNDLRQRHHRLTEQIGAVNFNVESLQEMVKELQNGNAEVREICKKHEDEKIAHSENLKNMEKISEKIKTLEESSESLSDMLTVHLSEKELLISQLESIDQDMENLSERNIFLENSLFDANFELEGLRIKLKEVEESCRSLCAQNSNFLSEKGTLVSQVERTTQSLENLEMRYAELEGKHLNLEREKNLALLQVMVLQDSMKQEKEEYKTLILSSKSHLCTLENQISLLHEESRVREEEFDVEQHKIMDAHTEIFILQKCLCDMNEKNSILSVECQKLLVALNRADKLISELNQELLVQEKRLTASSEKLREGIQLTLRELLVDKHCGSLDGIEDEVLLQLTFHEVRDMLNSLSDARDEKQCLLLDKSVILTILEQFGVNLMDVTIEKNVLEQESSVKTKELSVLQIKELGLLEINEQLRQDVQSSNQKQEVLISQLDSIAQNMENLSEKNTVLEISLSNVNVELESLRRKSKDLEESCQSLCLQNSNHLSEKSTLVSQVESTTQSLVNLEMMYAELEGKYLKLGREKDLVLHQVIELQDSLQLEKEEYKTLDLSSKFQLSTLKNQISLLQEETRIREEEFEVEQHKIMDAQIEIFILQRCLYDTNEKKSILSVDCQKHLVQEKLISELKHQLLVRDKKLIATSGRSEKLREGIQLMLRELRVNNDSESLDGIKDEALLQLTLHENRNLHDENHRILLDKSVIVTILEQFGLNVMDLIMEKTDLERDVKTKTKELPVIQSKELELVEMNEQLRQDLRSSNQRQEVLCEELIDLREDHSTLQGAILKLLEENQSLSEKSNELKEKGDILEEENCIILAEAMTLEYLYLIHRNYSEEKSLELQSLSSDLDCLHGVKDELDQEVRLMNEKLVAVEVENESSLEECRRHLKILENDLNITRNVCRQLNQELESKRELLAQKDTELLEANKKFRSTQDKKTELCSNLEGLQLEIDTAMVVIGELENKIFCLLEDNSQRGNEIACLREANEVSNRELDRLHKGVEDLRSREAHLTSELQNEVDEVKSCEFEIATLLNDTHIATINAALFEEKVFELLITCESLEISAIIQKEILYEGISVRNSNVDELNEKIDRMEGENRGLKEELSACLLLVSTLWDDITSLEEHTLSLAKHPESNHREKQDSQLVSLQHNKSNQEQGELHSATVPAGILEFQKLHAKVQALEKLVIDTGSLLELEVIESNASLEAAMKGIEVLKSNRDSGQKESQISKDITMQLESSEEPGRDLKLQNSDARISNVKYEKMMNDIQLDLIRSSSQHENGVGSYESSTVDNAGTKDPIQELRETTERDYNTQMHKASSVTPVQEIEYEKIEAASIDEEKIEYPASEIVADKELSIDKLELQQKVAESNQEWNRKVMERLSSNAERLSALQTSLQQLRRNMEASEISSCDTSFESETIKAQLNEAEGAILESVDINTKLTRKAEDGSSSSGKQIEIRDTSRRQIAEHARRGSDKIGRLELDLQKIQYMLMKIEEEQENRRVRGTGSRRRIVLKDYLYGSIDGRRQKKGSSCGCRRPETKDD